MRRTVGLVLSSFVVTACTPSAAPPSPAIPGSHFAPVRDIDLGTARSGDADTLSVQVSGPSSLRATSSITFRATVVNATAKHHYYWWFVASCATRGGCAPTSYVPVGDGLDMTTVTIPFGAESSEKDIVVQAAEIDGDGRTGSSVEFVVIGPGRRLGDGADGFATSVCDWYAGSFYPHTGVYLDPFTGRTWKRNFRRDYCGNRVSWDPEG